LNWRFSDQEEKQNYVIKNLKICVYTKCGKYDEALRLAEELVTSAASCQQDDDIERKTIFPITVYGRKLEMSVLKKHDTTMISIDFCALLL
jgi:hypothetical protein